MGNIPFHLPHIGDEEIGGVVESLRSGWLTSGPKVLQFEREFAEYVGCRHAVAVNSCTAALHLALNAIGLREGDKVITTPMTFAATAEVIHYFRAEPVFVDIDSETLNINHTLLEKRINELKAPGSSPRAVIPVHYAGQPCDMDPIMQIARAHGLRVVEDAAHALPARYKDRTVGTIGDITCFSFYATKNITTGEGGMVATDNPEWADRLRTLRLHGISKDAWKRYASEGNWYYEITDNGYKYNLTDIAAALGIAQLKKADYLWERRKNIAAMYSEAFKYLPQIEVPSENSDVQHSWHLYVIRLRPEALTIDRDGFIRELKNMGIGTSVHFIPLHIHPYYRETYGYRPEDFPAAYETYRRIISLPIYPRMKDADVGRVIDSVTDVAERHKR